MKDTITDKDIIVAEVRKARDDHAKQFDYDLEAIVADIQKQQKESGRKFVSLPAKRIKPVTPEPATPSSAVT